jgi:hypothetical protein
MAISVPAFYRLTTLSASNNFSNTNTNIFASGSYTTNGFGIDTLSSSITFDQTQGAFTASQGGYYHVILNTIMGPGGGVSDSDRTIRFYRNDSTQVYGATVSYDYGDYVSGIERTFNAVVSMSAGDGLKFSSQATTTAANNYLSGTTVIIKKIESDFAWAGRLTNSTAITGDETGYLVGTVGSSFETASSGMTVTTGSNGFFTISNTGSYYMLYTNTIDDATTGTQWMTESVNTDFGGGFMTVAQRILSLPSATSVDERTFTFFANLDGNDVPVPAKIQIKTDTNGASGYTSRVGNGFTVIKTPQQAQFQLVCDIASSSLISTSSSPTNILSVSFMSGTVDNATPGSSSVPLGMTFSTSSGIITVTSGGYYHLTYVPKLSNNGAADAAVLFTIRKNSTNCTDGTLLHSVTTTIGNATDPIDYVLTTIVSASANDTLSICARDTAGSAKVFAETPTYFSIYRIDTYTPDPSLYSFSQSVGTSASNVNYGINTFSRSNQYDRNAEQVPFFLGTPGVLSLRGRTTTGSVTSTG